LGGPGRIVQVDETMLNFKVKSHRGRSSTNHTDALCIVEVRNGIERVYARTIPDKKATTIIPHITSQLAAGTTVWTHKHGAYNGLQDLGLDHGTVCHKYEFITHEGINTQAVESFNNALKLEIKIRKGILTGKREDFYE